MFLFVDVFKCSSISISIPLYDLNSVLNKNNLRQRIDWSDHITVKSVVVFVLCTADQQE